MTINIIPTINIKDEFSEITNLLEETTSPTKPMTFKVKYKNKYFVVKKLNEFSYDNIIIDKCKNIFGLNNIGNMIIFESIFDISKKNNKVFKNKNNKIKLFLMMNFIPNTNMISDYLYILDDLDIIKEYMKCGLFRGLFRCTDFRALNILFDENNNLYSIDENEIGMQKDIIKERDINIYIKKYITKNVLDEIINDIQNNKDEKLKKIKEILIEYNKVHFYECLKNNMDNLKKDIYENLDFQ